MAGESSGRSSAATGLPLSAHRAGRPPGWSFPSARFVAACCVSNESSACPGLTTVLSGLPEKAPPSFANQDWARHRMGDWAWQLSHQLSSFCKSPGGWNDSELGFLALLAPLAASPEKIGAVPSRQANNPEGAFEWRAGLLCP
jgi:hypothetical protein